MRENEEGGKGSAVPAFHLLSGEAIYALTRVLEHGARKYGANNWLKVSTQEHVNHAMMHLLAWNDGDSGDDHLEHALCRAMMAVHQAVAVPRPPIVCLCGSTSFRADFLRAQKEETMAGRIVLTVGFYGHLEGHCAPEEKEALDRLHLEKVGMADEVLVINRGGYVGASTRNEIAHAEALHKSIRWMYEVPPCGHCGRANWHRPGCPRNQKPPED